LDAKTYTPLSQSVLLPDGISRKECLGTIARGSQDGTTGAESGLVVYLFLNQQIGTYGPSILIEGQIPGGHIPDGEHAEAGFR